MRPLLASAQTSVPGKGSQIVLKLSQSTQVTSLTRLRQLLSGSDQLYNLAQVGEDASSACSRLPASTKYRFR